MPPSINHQPPLKPPNHLPIPIPIVPRNRPYQRLPHHLRQKNRQRIIIPKPGNLNRHLHPRPLPTSRIQRRPPRRRLLILPTILPRRRRRSVILRLPQIERAVGRYNRLLDLRFHPDDGLRAICEPDARAAVGAWQDVGFGGQGAELRG